MFHLQVLIMIFCLSFHNSRGMSRIDPLVQTNVGLIRGLKATDGDYALFLGIPYAKVDTDNPFGLSQKYPNFDTEFRAFNESDYCPQFDDDIGKLLGETLDCLRLNIYVPNSASSRNRLPVMVFIHGGNFEFGSARQDILGAKFLVRHDVILVTFNYRIGLYGYMCLHTPKIPGNQGFKDQLAALRWIKNNIEAFGGDTEKITVFGHSTGARSVGFHVVSKQEQLFQSAILQSGTDITRDTIYAPDLRAPVKLAQKLGNTTESLDEALQYLATVKPLEAVAAARDLKLVIKPCIEKELYNVESFITDYTINLDVTKAKKLNLMVGVTALEQVARYAEKIPEFFDTLNIINDRLHDYFDFNEDELNHWTQYIHHFYLGEEKISSNTMWEIIDFDSFFSYAHPAQRTIETYLENGAENIYSYIFSYNGSRHYYRTLKGVNVSKPAHADEIGYLFTVISMFPDEPTPEDQLIIDRLTTLWTNFAKYGNPTPNVTDLLPVEWKPVTKESMYYYDIDDEVSLGKMPWHAQAAFWDLFFEINWTRQKGYKNKALNTRRKFKTK